MAALEPTNELKVTMFGDFSMSYGGVQLKLERTNTTKAMQILQLLIYYGEKGVMRDTLLDALYGDDTALEPANNLKVTISNLRRLLVRAGLPPETTIVYRGGSYFWACTVPCTVDSRVFDATCAQAGKEAGKKKTDCWLYACNLYRTGGFLPHLQCENWAVTANAAYRERYFSCVRGLIHQLSETSEWETLLPIVTAAAANYPIEEFQLARIDCLMQLQRYTEAKQVYEEAARSLREDFDIGPSETLLDRCRRLDAMLCDNTDSITEFQQQLDEDKQGRGAYYCTYPGFIDAYRVVSRMLERNGQSAFLILCWLTDSKGHDVTERAKLEQSIPKASDAIREALRRGDLYTQPSRDRFLILLVGTSKENCSIVTARILESYRKNPERGISLSFKLAPIGDIWDQEIFQNKPNWEMSR